jgi:glucose/arabinose dehydrogenase
MKVASTVAAALSSCSVLVNPPPPPPPPGDTGLVLVAEGFDQPVHVTAPAGDTRLFVVEQTGRVKVVKDGAVLPVPFLDLATRVSLGSEQGLLSIAFDPGYASNGRVFVSYTDLQGDTRIVRYHVSADPDRLDPQSGDTILAVDQPYANHNGGLVAFGPDGYLYIGLGDGGSGGDPQGNGQRLTTLLGKILRIDVADGRRLYAVPPDNPFVGQGGGVKGEIWSYGLRNPWRFSFDRVTGDLYIGDVGQGAWEEIDVATAASGRGRGVNYGWNVMEGAHCYSAPTCSTAGLALPLVEYGHGEGCSVTGGHVYRGTAVPALAGHYFYADYCEGWIRSFRLDGGAATDEHSWAGILDAGGPISSFGEDGVGELYVVQHGGRVWRIE